MEEGKEWQRTEQVAPRGCVKAKALIERKNGTQLVCVSH